MMKIFTKGIWILVACGVALGAIFGIRALVRQDDVIAQAADEQTLYTPEAESGLAQSLPVESPEETSPATLPTPVEPIEPGMDIKRGSFLTDEIVAQLDEIVREETIGGVWVGVSSVVQGDTRAFVKVCLALASSQERMMVSGPTWLDFPGGKTDAFFAHNDISDENGVACQVLEFVGVNSDKSQDGWRFNMESVIFALPDEGTECDVYQKRAEADKDLREAGITVACIKGEGMTNLEILTKPAGLDEADAQKMVDDAVLGRHNGPWIFELPMEAGLSFNLTPNTFHQCRSTKKGTGREYLSLTI